MSKQTLIISNLLHCTTCTVWRNIKNAGESLSQTVDWTCPKLWEYLTTVFIHFFLLNTIYFKISQYSNEYMLSIFIELKHLWSFTCPHLHHPSWKNISIIWCGKYFAPPLTCRPGLPAGSSCTWPGSRGSTSRPAPPGTGWTAGWGSAVSRLCWL